MTAMTLMTDLGKLTLHANDRGLTGITLPGTGAASVNPARKNNPDHPVLNMAARQITEYFAGTRTVFDLPLSITGTSFQQQAWEFICRIPYGQTDSYGEIARKMGNVRKARAVGGAAHANPLPLIIPCHRVIGADGKLTGFAGGLDMKKKLLAMEKINKR